MILFSSVTKTFGDGTTALEDVSFSIKPGEFVFVTGPSGSGKTTLMRLLIKEYSPSAGNIEFDGTPLKKFKGRKLPKHRRNIGVIFQDYKLLPELNVWENIALPLYITGKSQSEIESRVTDLLQLVSIEDKAWLFPSQLSGGESQRVSIARALANGPKVIFADEPTGNLDTETGLKIAKLLKKINELGTTLIFATHDIVLLEALSNERRLHLEGGALVSDKESTLKKKTEKPKQQEKKETTENSKEVKDTNKSKGPRVSLTSLLPFGKKKQEKAEDKNQEDKKEKVSVEVEEL